MLRRNIAESGLTEFVQPVIQRSYEVAWEQPIAFLLIDGLHDYLNVSRDFRHFEPWVMDGGLVAFHDYGNDFPAFGRSSASYWSLAVM